MNDLIFDFFKELVRAWREGPAVLRRFLVAGVTCVVIAMVLGLTGELINDYQNTLESFTVAFAGAAGVLSFGVYIYRKSIEETEREQQIEAVEQRVKDNPKETQAAWELARVKLESYLNRNLKQVRSIFWLTVFVMLVGFALIGFGVYSVIESPGKLAAAVIASGSGVLVNFIGATFLVLYKSTMTQATEYVSILERINAVGMSVQILDTIDDDENKLKQQTTAEISKQLLALYTSPQEGIKRI